jgi:antitoxin (DNA-binding transcriptional repressor) of toxin-antitoxin stability system
MHFASVAEVKDKLSRYWAQARKRNGPTVVTPHGKPYALIQPIAENDLEELDWKRLAATRLQQAWEGEDDALYDCL